MDAYINRLNEQKLAMVERMKEIVTTAEAETRDLTPEENDNLTKWDADFMRVDADIKRLIDLEKRTAADDTFREAVAPVLRESRIVTPSDSDAQRFVKFWKGESPEFESFRTTPAGVAGWESRALQSAGGSAIDTSFADFVSVYERTLNPMMDIATVLSTADGSPIVLPRLTADAGVASGTVTAEAAGITEGDATISQVTIAAWKRAYTSLWSAELDADNVIGLQSLIARSIGRQLGLAWGTAFTTGNDSSEANGFLNAIGSGAQLGTAGGTASGTSLDTFIAAADLVDAFYLLAAPYRANASWVVSNTALAKMAKFRSSTGEFLFAGSQVLGKPDTFLGRPVYENPAMAAVASATKSVAVGDFSAFIIREAGGIRIDRSTEYKFSTDQIALRVITRRDSDLPDVTAIRAIVSANT